MPRRGKSGVSACITATAAEGEGDGRCEVPANRAGGVQRQCRAQREWEGRLQSGCRSRSCEVQEVEACMVHGALVTCDT